MTKNLQKNIFQETTFFILWAIQKHWIYKKLFVNVLEQPMYTTFTPHFHVCSLSYFLVPWKVYEYPPSIASAPQTVVNMSCTRPLINYPTQTSYGDVNTLILSLSKVTLAGVTSYFSESITYQGSVALGSIVTCDMSIHSLSLSVGLEVRSLDFVVSGERDNCICEQLLPEICTEAVLAH